MKIPTIYSLTTIALLCWFSSSYAHDKVVIIPLGGSCRKEVIHCDGNPYGGLINDACNVCGGDGSSCAGCDGVPNSGLILDDCGVCDNNHSNDNTTCTEDCSGTLGGTATTDACGICDDDATNDNITCVITDIATGLMWQQADDGIVRNWQEAVDYCNELNLANQTDWRLPTKDELKSIVVCSNGTPTPLLELPLHPYSCGTGNTTEPFDEPTISDQYICRARTYWSASTYDDVDVWYVHFQHGGADIMGRLFGGYARCVR